MYFYFHKHLLGFVKLPTDEHDIFLKEVWSADYRKHRGFTEKNKISYLSWYCYFYSKQKTNILWLICPQWHYKSVAELLSKCKHTNQPFVLHWASKWNQDRYKLEFLSVYHSNGYQINNVVYWSSSLQYMNWFIHSHKNRANCFDTAQSFQQLIGDISRLQVREN